MPCGVPSVVSRRRASPEGGLIKHAGKVITHRQLLKEVWGTNYINQTHYVRVYVGQLRQKLEVDPARPRLLQTEPAVGYRFRSE